MARSVAGVGEARRAVAFDEGHQNVARADPVEERRRVGVGVGLRCVAKSGGAVYRADDGGLMVSGMTTSSGAGGMDILLIKLDQDGNELWPDDEVQPW